MAGLDTKGASDFIAMLQEFGSKDSKGEAHHDPVQLCTESIKTTQMATDSLLLRERDVPLSQQSYSGCCDTMVPKIKEMQMSIEAVISDLVGADPVKIAKHLSQVTSTLCVIVETTAQAVYMVSEKTPGCVKAVPSVIDAYILNRGRLAIEVASNSLTRGSIQKEQMMAVAAVFATHLELIRQQCQSATAKLLKSEPNDAAQFSAIGKSVASSAAVLVTSIKAFVTNQSQEAQNTIALFTKPILALIDALIEFSMGNKFVGSPPKVKREVADYIKPMQAASLSAASATTLLIAGIKVVLTNPSDRKAKDSISSYNVQINSALGSLVVAMKSARDAKIMFEDPK